MDEAYCWLLLSSLRDNLKGRRLAGSGHKQGAKRGFVLLYLTRHFRRRLLMLYHRRQESKRNGPLVVDALAYTSNSDG